MQVARRALAMTRLLVVDICSEVATATVLILGKGSSGVLGVADNALLLTWCYVDYFCSGEFPTSGS
jgi:hypothetical protein